MRPSFSTTAPKSAARLAMEAQRQIDRAAVLAEIEAARITRGFPTLKEMETARLAGLALLQKWRSFTRDKARLSDLCDTYFEFQSWDVIDEIRAIIARTERHADELADTVRKARPAGVDWTDSVVVVGLKLLTKLDEDQARLANDKGWSKSTSPGGHWCTAMLDIDRELAIKHGRTLLAKHLKQLRHIDPVVTRRSNPTKIGA